MMEELPIQVFGQTTITTKMPMDNTKTIYLPFLEGEDIIISTNKAISGQ